MSKKKPFTRVVTVRLCGECVKKLYPNGLVLYGYPSLSTCRCEKCGNHRCADWVKPEAEHAAKR